MVLLSMKTETIYKSYSDLTTLKEYLVEQGEKVTFKFPSTLSNDNIEELSASPRKLNATCSCTNWSIQSDLNQITFVITAPNFNEDLSNPYLKSVMPVFKSDTGNVTKWDIKFYVKPTK